MISTPRGFFSLPHPGLPWTWGLVVQGLLSFLGWKPLGNHRVCSTGFLTRVEPVELLSLAFLAVWPFWLFTHPLDLSVFT